MVAYFFIGVVYIYFIFRYQVNEAMNEWMQWQAALLSPILYYKKWHCWMLQMFSPSKYCRHICFVYSFFLNRTSNLIDISAVIFIVFTLFHFISFYSTVFYFILTHLYFIFFACWGVVLGVSIAPPSRRALRVPSSPRRSHMLVRSISNHQSNGWAVYLQPRVPA